MAQAKQKSASAIKQSAKSTTLEDASAADYSNNMFRDGNNRVATIKNAHAYDDAANNADSREADTFSTTDKGATLLDTSLDMADNTTPERLLAMKQDTSRSRDGTDASGSLDESGGFLGGTTEEVDDLETTAMPVDKIPHMKD